MLGDDGGANDVMRPVLRLLREHVDPVAKAAGFRRRRLQYYRKAPSGDYVMIFIADGAADGDSDEFTVQPAAAPVPIVDWLCELRDESRPVGRLPGRRVCLQLPEIPPPPTFWSLAPHRTVYANPATAPEPRPIEDWQIAGYPNWAFDDEEELAACGRELACALQDGPFDDLSHLLDREALLAKLHADPRPTVGLLPIESRFVYDLVIRIDTTPVAELEALLFRANMECPQWPVQDWARLRLARRGNAGDPTD